MNRTRLPLVVGILVATLSSGGCNTVGSNRTATQDPDPKVVVAERAEARWKALIDSDVGQAYNFLSPASKKAMSRAEYLAMIKPGMWRTVKPVSVTCAEDVCKAILQIKYDIQRVKDLEMKVEETWVKENGIWWYVQPQ